jgi:hypothetical protein
LVDGAPGLAVKGKDNDVFEWDLIGIASGLGNCFAKLLRLLDGQTGWKKGQPTIPNLRGSRHGGSAEPANP